jgi:putative ABC transport system substrate-binding protein
MNVRAFLAMTLGFCVLGGAQVAEAQPAGKIPQLCFLTFDPGTAQSPSARFDEFFQGLRDLGYVHGQTIAIHYLTVDGRSEQFPALASDCVRLKADVIVVSTTPGAQAAKKATGTIPIVMLSLGDPVATGLVDSLARPKGNITGMSNMASGLAAKRLELLKEAMPRLVRVLVLSYLADPIAPLQVKALQEAAPSLGVTLQVRDVRAVDDFAAAFEVGVRERAQAVLVTSGSIFRVNRVQVTELAARHRLPAIYPYSVMASENGGLMAYAVDEPDLHRRAASYVDQILKGAKASDLAIQQPTKFEFVINLKTAKVLGLTIPPTLLIRATETIHK